MRFLLYIVLASVAPAAIALSTALFVMPRMNWSAAAKPSAFETRIADWVRERWIGIHSADHKNPLAPTSENLASGRKEYNEHCGVCHGIDGGGRNRFRADFYPPVARLTGVTHEMSDAEIYFVIANGVALSGMPAFGEHHGAQEIWKLVLWVRRLANLTPEERKKIELETSEQERRHEEVMRQGTEHNDLDVGK